MRFWHFAETIIKRMDMFDRAYTRLKEDLSEFLKVWRAFIILEAV